MFDVFYSGIKPNLFAHEQSARDIQHARELSRTRYFWWINYLTDYTGWDFLWEPVPWDSRYTHTWPSQHHEFGGTYLVPKHVDTVEYKFHDRVLPLKNMPNNYKSLVDDVEFDWSWHPHPHDPPFIYVFGNQWWPANKMPCIEYHVSGAVDRKYMDHPQAQLLPQAQAPWHILKNCQWDYSWRPDPGDPPYIYVFGNQWHRAEVMPTVEYRVAGATERKFMHYPRAQLLPDATHWIVPDSINQDEVDFSWVPDPGSPPYIYQFATQHQKTGGPQYCVPGATEVKYIDQIRIRTSRVATALYEIDHLDGSAGQISNTTKVVRYFDNYLDTLKRLARSVSEQHEFIWICSSICDYANFDFSWHPEQWQATMLHVFSSDDEKFGDTFFMHVPSFLQRTEHLELLEWYDLNFVSSNITRRPMPVIQNCNDTHVDAVLQTQWQGPLALFTTGAIPTNIPTVALWREKTKTIVPLDSGAESIIVPRGAVSHIRTQLYDYPYVDKSRRSHTATLQDVIFISNGESMAESNWQHLVELCPRAKRSDGVVGREAAYKAAATLSNTPWFFAVFAKTEVLPSFKFDFQPDRMQQPKHYIFHSRNPLNGLEYGAMNINLYNRQLTLDTIPGLDFTLSSAHEVIPICASISRFNTDPWVTWRSAFREVLKLKREVELGADVEIQHRLHTWTTHAQGQNAQHCLQGAQDALNYYQKISGRIEDLQLSFDWAWLQDYYYSLYQTRPWLESV